MRKRELQLHIARRLFSMLLAILLLTLPAAPALGDADRAELTLPVRCAGPGCTVGLFDAAGILVDETTLDADGAGLLRLTVTGAGVHRYTVRLTNADDGAVSYDPNRYTVKVAAALSADKTELLVTVTVNNGEGQKAEELLFVNDFYPVPTLPPTPTPTPTPTETPTPTDEPPGPTDEPGPTDVPPEFDDLDENGLPTTMFPTTTLPQTGQLWWPVPVLAGLGLILILAGVVVCVKNRREKSMP